MFNENAPPKGMPFSSACMASSSMRRNPGEALGGVCTHRVPVLKVSSHCQARPSDFRTHQWRGEMISTGVSEASPE